MFTNYGGNGCDRHMPTKKTRTYLSNACKSHLTYISTLTRGILSKISDRNDLIMVFSKDTRSRIVIRTAMILRRSSSIIAKAWCISSATTAQAESILWYASLA